MITDPFAVLVVLAAVVYVSIVLDEQFRIFHALGSVLVAILMGMALSNVGLLPDTSPTYDFLASTGVSVAIVLILLTVDVRSVFSAGPKMLAAFFIGAAGTALGAVSAALALAGEVGPETWKLAGQYTGTYTGGGVNFAALGRAFETSSDMFSAAVAADVAITAIWLIACLSLPVLLSRNGSSMGGRPAASDELKPHGAGAVPDSAAALEADLEEAGAALGVSGISADLKDALQSTLTAVSIAEAAALVTLSVGLVWLAGVLAAAWPVPEVLLLTTMVLLAAQLPGIKALSGSAMWGNYLLHLFLAANGAQSVIANIFRIGPEIFYFAAATVAVHGVIIFGVGRLMKIDAATLAVASQANVGGPASAMALAGTRGYTELLLPGIAVGLLGYAVGNYMGYVVGVWIVQPFLGA
ncbi:MAG: DUF819 family protein [Acidobacteriota bacterium]|jgi:uncharacterized membrane protein